MMARTEMMAQAAAEEAVAALMAEALVMVAMALAVIPALAVTLAPVVTLALVAVLVQGRVTGCSSQSVEVSMVISRMLIRLLPTPRQNLKRYLISSKGLLIQS